MDPVGQDTVIEFLGTADAYGGQSGAVRRIDTHGSIVFLYQDRAFKMKRAVGFEYMDFSTLKRRRACCEAEVQINEAGAPGLYQRAVPVTQQSDGGLAIGGNGTPVEWLVEMTRFDEATLFDRLAEDDTLTPELINAAAKVIAEYLDGAKIHREPGSSETLGDVVEESARMLAAGEGLVFDATAIRRAVDGARVEAERLSDFLDRRRQGGWVRRGHGDLHLRNIAVHNGVPILFDAIEFNDRLAIVDVLYDLAFLLMDLLHQGMPAAANRILNGHLEHAGGYDSVAALPLFLASRAMIRAHVAVPAAKAQTDPIRAEQIRSDARKYLDLAITFLAPPPPVLVAVGGLSGTGKSVQSRALAPALGAPPGAVVLRSDIRRKSIMGVGPLDRLGPDGYTPDVTVAVYAGILQDAELALSAGHAVILDAVYARPTERAAVNDLAQRLDIPFTGIWLTGIQQTLLERVAARTNDASDADGAIVRAQAEFDTGPMDWTEVEAEGSEHETSANISALLGL
ncbi:MAG: AAA family ATPase [Alphaproteobacteria bacterium]|jgi:uncharacterized protein|nr:AAA family ATPase [Alphaproteobacteria bacterium]MBT5859795.1 AAA family ATPase [Alphaproteobacteria bacterium]